MRSAKRAVRHPLARSVCVGPHDPITHFGGAVTVLEISTVGADVFFAADRAQEVVELVDEGVLRSPSCSTNTATAISSCRS
jgi:hypothetical protein